MTDIQREGEPKTVLKGRYRALFTKGDEVKKIDPIVLRTDDGHLDALLPEAERLVGDIGGDNIDLAADKIIDLR